MKRNRWTNGVRYLVLVQKTERPPREKKIPKLPFSKEEGGKRCLVLDLEPQREVGSCMCAWEFYWSAVLSKVSPRHQVGSVFHLLASVYPLP